MNMILHLHNVTFFTLSNKKRDSYSIYITNMLTYI